jgi:hypothetical protein
VISVQDPGQVYCPQFLSFKQRKPEWERPVAGAGWKTSGERRSGKKYLNALRGWIVKLLK